MALDRINATALLDGGVTTADIADDAVTTAKLATQTGNVDFADNGRIRLGDSQDLQIYHDGSHSYISDQGTGRLKIFATDLEINNAGNTANYIQAFDGGAVSLFHNNAIKLATTTTGVDVTGTLTVDSNLLVGSSSAVGNANANELELTNPAGSGTVGMTFNVNSGSADTGNIYWRSNAVNNNIQIVGDPVINYLAFATSGAERMRIDNSGNVGIGSTGPSSSLTVQRASAAATLNLRHTASGNGYGYIFGTTGTTSNILSISSEFNGTPTEHLRINDSGNLMVGSTSINYAEKFKVENHNSYTIHSKRTTSGAEGHIVFSNVNGAVGSIFTNGTTTSYNTSSDYRLKENVEYDFDATTRIKQLKPARFNFIADADSTVDGFLAHEVQDVVPEAITGTKDAMRDEEYEVTPAVLDEDGNEVTPAVMATRSVPEYQGIDQAKLVPLLVKSLQEALDKIDTLETRLEALENA